LEKQDRVLRKELSELASQKKEFMERGILLKRKISEADSELGALDSQKGQQLSRVEALSPHSAQAWKWIQDHPSEFEKEIYGPALITCSVKDNRYTAAIEACLNRSDLLAFTAQTAADFDKLQKTLLGRDGLGLADVTIRQISEQLSELNEHPLSANQMQQHGLQGWVIDFIDGPEPVLAMLCNSKRINACGVTLAEINEQQHYTLVDSRVFSWVSDKYCYKVNRRAEYGPQASSTTTKAVRKPQYWTDAPVDSSAKREVEARKATLEQEFEELKQEHSPLKARLDELQKELEANKLALVSVSASLIAT
jgi:chromosome segregation ATPase